jgi:hypothetical protein
MNKFFCLILGHTWIPVSDNPKTNWNVDKTGHLLLATAASEIRFFDECVRCRERRPVVSKSR